MPKTAAVSPDLEPEDPEAVLGSSSDDSAAATPTKRHRGQPREGTPNPAKQAGPKLSAKRSSLEKGQAGPSRSAGKGDSSSRHSGRRQVSFSLPRSEASPRGAEEVASGQGDRPHSPSLPKSPAMHETQGKEKSPHRRSKVLPRRALDFEATTDEGDAAPTTRKTPPRAPRSSTSPPADVESPVLRRMPTKEPYQGNVSTFEPRIHSTPVVPSRKAPAGEASAPLAEDLDSSDSGTSNQGRRPAPGGKQAEPPDFSDLPTTRHAQCSLLEMLRRGGKKRDASPRASVKQPSPEHRSSGGSKTARVPARQKRPSFLAQDDFVECPAEEEEGKGEEEAREDKEGATSAAALSAYKELLSSGHGKHSGSASRSLPKRGRPKGSSGLPAPPSGHGAQDAADWDLPSTSRGHRSGSPVATTSSQDGADKATKDKKKKNKKKKVCLAVQMYQPEGVERLPCQATSFDAFLTFAMEEIDYEIEHCQSAEDKQILELYKQNIIKETCKVIEELNVYTVRLPELEEEQRKLRAMRENIEALEEKVVRCVRENGLNIDPYEFLVDEEDM